MKYVLIFAVFLIASTSCKKDNCQTCTKTIGGFAGTYTDEIREVCDNNEATELEESSSGTTVFRLYMIFTFF